MREEEIIRLDARVTGVIGNSAFRAELANGHRIVAFASGADKEKASRVGAGDAVRVEMFPYDMSRGRLIWNRE